MSVTSAEQIAAVAKINASAYHNTIPLEAQDGRQLLIQHTVIPSDRIDEHIHKIRDKAWAVFPYGCVGAFYFLRLKPILEDPQFQAVTKRLLTPGSTEVFLEIGCCLGEVIRQLIADGVPSERLYGTDLQPAFLELGKELFCDGDKSKATLVPGDMLNGDDARLDELNGRVDIIYASAFFHLFEKHDQVRAAKRMVGFLKPDNPRAMIFGRNEGKKTEGSHKYILDGEGWKSVWDEVGEATGTRWKAELIDEGSETWHLVRFSASRVM